MANQQYSDNQPNVDDLVDNLDNLPSIMSEIKESSSSSLSSPPHYHHHHHHHQPPQQTSEASHHSNFNKVNFESDIQSIPDNSLTKQASKVIDSLKKLPLSKKLNKSIITDEIVNPVYLSEIATKALKGIEKIESSYEIPASKIYSAYDTCKRGVISYDDFADLLVHTNTGVSKEVAKLIAIEMDTKKTGLVEYNNLPDKLRHVIETHGKVTKTEEILDPHDRDDHSSFLRSNHIYPSNSSHSFPNTVDIIDIKILSPNLKPLPNPKRNKDIVSIPVKNQLEESNLPETDDLIYPPRRHYNHRDRPIPYALDLPSEESKSLTRLSSVPPRKQNTSLLHRFTDDSILEDDQGKDIRISGHYDRSMKETKNKLSSYLEKLSQSNPNIGQNTTSSSSSSVIETIALDEVSNTHVSTKTEPMILKSRIPPEMSAAAQINGNINRLRHALKSIDRSKSGYVNFGEFKSAISKLGVQLSQQDTIELFQKNISKNPDAADVGIGYNHGHGLKIDDFLDVIQSVSSAPVLSPKRQQKQASSFYMKHPLGYQMDSKSTEERRVLRGILHGLEKVSDPLTVFHKLDKHHHGYVQPKILRHGLKDMGIDLSDREYNLLMNTIDLNHDGKIDLMEFKQVLDQKVNKYDQEERRNKLQTLRQHPHYSSSYQVSSVLTDYQLPEYDTSSFDRSRAHRKDSLKWTKLKETLTANKDKILKAFTSKKALIPGRGRLEELPYSDLIKRLDRNGIQLGKEDHERLELQVSRYLQTKEKSMGQIIETPIYELEYSGNTVLHPKIDSNSNSDSRSEPRLTVDVFCDILGLSVAKTQDKTEIVDKREDFVDGGIFHDSASRFQLTHPGVTSTMLLDKVDIMIDEANVSSGRRKYKGPIYPHTYEPSKFWELSHSEKDILIPMPLMSYRDPSIPSLRERQYARTNSKYVAVHPTTRRISKGVDIPAAKMTVDGILAIDTNLNASRSSSAPPRSMSSVNRDSVNMDSVNMDSVSRWGSQTLAEFARMKISGESMSPGRGLDTTLTNIGFPVSNRSLDSSAVSSVFEHPRARYGTADNAIRIGSRTLRKQHRLGESTQAPFALGY